MKGIKSSVVVMAGVVIAANCVEGSGSIPNGGETQSEFSSDSARLEDDGSEDSTANGYSARRGMRGKILKITSTLSGFNPTSDIDVIKKKARRERIRPLTAAMVRLSSDPSLSTYGGSMIEKKAKDGSIIVFMPFQKDDIIPEIHIGKLVVKALKMPKFLGDDERSDNFKDIVKRFKHSFSKVLQDDNWGHIFNGYNADGFIGLSNVVYCLQYIHNGDERQSEFFSDPARLEGDKSEDSTANGYIGDYEHFKKQYQIYDEHFHTSDTIIANTLLRDLRIMGDVQDLCCFDNETILSYDGQKINVKDFGKYTLAWVYIKDNEADFPLGFCSLDMRLKHDVQEIIKKLIGHHPSSKQNPFEFLAERIIADKK
jgi:hypothetical protein